MEPERVRLIVLFGGQSAEHAVSRVSARHLLAAIDPERYEIEPIGITKEGRWVRAEEAAVALRAGADTLPDALPVAGPDVQPAAAVARRDPGERTVVFPLLHGPLGEDGTVQGLLELADVAYVGCGVLGSALSMDKAKAKEVFAAAGIPQARFEIVHETELGGRAPGSGNDGRAPGSGNDGGAPGSGGGDGVAVAERLAASLGFPAFVKPANMGSSIGVAKVRTIAELIEALTGACRYDEWLVVEEGIDGREIECAVLGNLEPRASVPGEIEPGADFYDYEDKYVDGNAKLLIPAPLDETTTAELRALAVRAYRALRCEGMARVDFFYEEDGRGLLVNEINTIPGFTPISMYPKMWEATGLPYAELIDELVRLALDRHDRRAAKRHVD